MLYDEIIEVVDFYCHRHHRHHHHVELLLSYMNKQRKLLIIEDIEILLQHTFDQVHHYILVLLVVFRFDNILH